MVPHFSLSALEVGAGFLRNTEHSIHLIHCLDLETNYLYRTHLVQGASAALIYAHKRYAGSLPNLFDPHPHPFSLLKLHQLLPPAIPRAETRSLHIGI